MYKINVYCKPWTIYSYTHAPYIQNIYLSIVTQSIWINIPTQSELYTLYGKCQRYVLALQL